MEHYLVSTTFVPSRSDLTSEIKKYHYDQINTISVNRLYDLAKVWSIQDTEENRKNKENIKAVQMTLKRCLTQNLNTTTPGWEVYSVEYVKPDSE